MKIVTPLPLPLTPSPSHRLFALGSLAHHPALGALEQRRAPSRQVVGCSLAPSRVLQQHACRAVAPPLTHTSQQGSRAANNNSRLSAGEVAIAEPCKQAPHAQEGARSPGHPPRRSALLAAHARSTPARPQGRAGPAASSRGLPSRHEAQAPRDCTRWGSGCGGVRARRWLAMARWRRERSSRQAGGRWWWGEVSE